MWGKFSGGSGDLNRGNVNLDVGVRLEIREQEERVGDYAVESRNGAGQFEKRENSWREKREKGVRVGKNVISTWWNVCHMISWWNELIKKGAALGNGIFEKDMGSECYRRFCFSCVYINTWKHVSVWELKV
jgi:hypothetical protein